MNNQHALYIIIKHCSIHFKFWLVQLQQIDKLIKPKYLNFMHIPLARRKAPSEGLRARVLISTGVNETWAEGDSVTKQERSLEETVRRK